MTDMISIKDITDTTFLEHFKRLQRLNVSEGEVNPLMKYIMDKGEVRCSLIEYFNCSEFLENLTEETIEVSKKLFDAGADTEWFQLLHFIIEEKDESEEFARLLVDCEKTHMPVNKARECVESCNNVEEFKMQFKKYINEALDWKEQDMAEIVPEMGKVPQEKEAKESDLYMDKQYKELCSQQKDFIDQLRSQISVYQESQNNILQQKTNLEKCLEAANKDLENLRTEKQELLLKLEELQMHSPSEEVLQSENDDLIEEGNNLETLVSEPDSVTNERSKLEEECKVLNHTIEQLEGNIESLKRQIREKDISYQAIHNSMTSSRRELLSQKLINSRLVDEKAVLEDKSKELNQKVEELSAVIDSSEKEIADLRGDNTKLSERNNWFESENANLQSEIEQLREEKEVLSAEIPQLEEQNAALAKSMNEAQEIINNLNQTVTSKDEEISGLNAENSSLKKSLDEAIRQTEQYKRMLDQYNSMPNARNMRMVPPNMVQGILPGSDYTQNNGVEFGNEEFSSMPVKEPEQFPNSQKIEIKSGKGNVEKKSNWFLDHFKTHSKKNFLKNSRQDQESYVFIKMMESGVSNDLVHKVKKELTENENIPCYDLYKLVCKKASSEELDAFFEQYRPAPAV